MTEYMYSVAILCGGRSTRMGQDKAEMTADGMRMADRLLEAFSGCDEILLSVRDEEQGKTLAGDACSCHYVIDPVKDAGPLAGLVASLRACRNDLLFAAAVDQPFLDRAFSDELLRTAGKGSEWRDAAIPADPYGRLHSLSAFYNRTCLPHLETCLADGTYCLRDCLAGLKIKKVPVPELTSGNRKLINLNRPEDVENWLSRLSGREHDF